MSSMQLTYDHNNGPPTPLVLFYVEAHNRGMVMRLSGNRETAAIFEEIIPDDSRVMSISEDGDGAKKALFEWQDALVYIHHYKASGYSMYYIASTDMLKNRKVEALLLNRIPAMEVLDDGNATITFWTLNSHGHAESRNRMIPVQSWPAISANYPSTTRTHLQALMDTEPPFEAGRLILLHGLPGTGKTYTIRSLAKQWLPWCDTHYVVDPENFFGMAHYMMSVMLDDQNQRMFRATDQTPDNALILNGVNRFRLLVIEDSDEFLRIDAKERSGQALSRLLNSADGLVGQGLNFLFLITTNVSLADIHPAVSRIGRCVANLGFENFSAQEATDWLGVPTGSSTLADLFEQRRVQRQIASAPHRRPGQYV